MVEFFLNNDFQCIFNILISIKFYVLVKQCVYLSIVCCLNYFMFIELFLFVSFFEN